MTTPARPGLRRVVADLAPHRHDALRGGVAVVVGVACATAGPYVVGVVVDRGVIGRNVGWVIVLTAGYAALSGAQATAIWLESRWLGRFAQSYLERLRAELVGQLLRLDLDFFARERSGRLVSRLTSDVENLQQFLENGLGMVLRAVLLLCATLTVMWLTSPPLAAVVSVVLLPLAGAHFWYRRRAFMAQVDLRDQLASLLAHVNESLVGMRVVQAYGIESDQRRRFREVNLDAYRARMGIARVAAAYYPVVELLHPVALAVVIWYGATLVAGGDLAVGTLVAFTLYLTRLFEPIQQLTEFSHVVQAASASFAKVFAFRDERPLIADRPGAADLVPGTGEIVLDGVSFHYDHHGPAVLDGVDLRIVPGERLALVGASGAGKSTLAKVVVRFYDPSAGRVLVDGQDVREVTSESLRRHVALVPQEGFLFDGSVADNIALARPGTTRSDVERACRLLGIAERLAALPAGLDTPVMNRGLSLSAGQRQLVALARAFVAEPRVLILDEATSNLDPATELLVEQALRTLFSGRTAIVIAHRVTSALRADRVVVMEHGRVVEVGRPDDLLVRESAFTRWISAAVVDEVGPRPG